MDKVQKYQKIVKILVEGLLLIIKRLLLTHCLVFTFSTIFNRVLFALVIDTFGY